MQVRPVALADLAHVPHGLGPAHVAARGLAVCPARQPAHRLLDVAEPAVGVEIELAGEPARVAQAPGAGVVRGEREPHPVLHGEIGLQPGVQPGEVGGGGADGLLRIVRVACAERSGGARQDLHQPERAGGGAGLRIEPALLVHLRDDERPVEAVRRRFAPDDRVVRRKPAGALVADALLAVAADPGRALEILLVDDVEEEPAVLPVEELVESRQQLRVPAAHRPPEGDGAAQGERLAHVGAVAELQIEHVARGHGEVDAPLAHRGDQRLGLRILRRGVEIELETGAAEPLEGAPVGAARVHRHRAPGEILDPEEGVVVVAGHQVVVDVVERARHHDAGRAPHRVDRQRRRGDVTGAPCEHFEERLAVRREHHLDVQIEPPRELAQQLVLEAHLLAAPQEEGRRVVAGDDAQHPAAPDLGQIATPLDPRQTRELFDGEEPVESFEQVRRLRADRPCHRVSLERPAHDPQRGPLLLDPDGVVDVHRGHVEPALDDPLQQGPRRRVLGDEPDLDVRVVAARVLHDVPERRSLPDRDLPSREVGGGLDAVVVAAPHHEVLAGAVRRQGEGDLLPARLGDGDVRGEEVARPGDQGRDERIPVPDLHPVDVEVMPLRETVHERAAEPVGRGGVSVSVAALRITARNDDGEGPSRCDQLERRGREAAGRLHLRARPGRADGPDERGAEQHREMRERSAGAGSWRH